MKNLPAYEDGTVFQNKIQMPGNYPEEGIQHSEHSKSLKSRILPFVVQVLGIAT